MNRAGLEVFGNKRLWKYGGGGNQRKRSWTRHGADAANLMLKSLTERKDG